ncbi:MAG: hypothetical protein ABSD59_24890 [Terracidiphilus sp.]|jgi:hypothetical protein
MPPTPSIVFANVTCRFGGKYILLDLAEEIAIPAFTDSSLKRRYGPTSYFFIDVGILDVSVEDAEEPQLTIYGRFVKDTVLTRSQTYSLETGLVPDDGSLASAPSSFFALDLNNHKLAYLPETSYAPSIAVFASTVQTFMRRKHIAFVRALYELSKTTDQPISLTSLFEEYPAPDVDATPMANKASITEFLNAFSTLTHLEFRILQTNAEISRQETFRALQAMKNDISATSTKLIHDSKDGLNIRVATEEINASAAAGNQKVVLAGQAEDGTQLRGSNDSFKLRVAADDAPAAPTAKAAYMVKEYFKQVKNGLLRPDLSEGESQKITKIRENLGGSINQG